MASSNEHTQSFVINRKNVVDRSIYTFGLSNDQTVEKVIMINQLTVYVGESYRCRKKTRGLICVLFLFRFESNSTLYLDSLHIHR